MGHEGAGMYSSVMRKVNSFLETEILYPAYMRKIVLKYLTLFQLSVTSGNLFFVCACNDFKESFREKGRDIRLEMKTDIVRYCRGRKVIGNIS